MTADETTRRMIELESALAHLQHVCDQLNDSILYQEKVIADLRGQIQRMEMKLDARGHEEKRDLEDERPPHY